MDKRIKMFHNKNFVIYKEQKYYYELNSNNISYYFDIVKLLEDNEYLTYVADLGFKLYEKRYKDQKGYFWNTFFIPVSKNFIEFYYLYWTKDNPFYSDKIELIKTDLNNNVDSFYEFSLEVEIEGFRTKFSNSNALPAIYLRVPENAEDLKLKMVSMFGESETVPENKSDKYGQFTKHFIVPTQRIDKIIGIKRYRDTSTFGQKDGEQFTGEVEEIVLDLHKFDEHIYQIFKEHGMLEIE